MDQRRAEPEVAEDEHQGREHEGQPNEAEVEGCEQAGEHDGHGRARQLEDDLRRDLPAHAGEDAAAQAVARRGHRGRSERRARAVRSAAPASGVLCMIVPGPPPTASARRAATPFIGRDQSLGKPQAA